MKTTDYAILAAAIIVACAITMFAPSLGHGEYSSKPIHVKVEFDDIDWRRAGRAFTVGVHQELLSREVDNDSISTLIRVIESKLDRKARAEIRWTGEDSGEK